MLKSVATDHLPKGSFERFIAEVTNGTVKYLADTRWVSDDAAFQYLPIRGVDTYVAGGLDIYTPSKSGFLKERISAKLGKKNILLLRVRYDYNVSQFTIECCDADVSLPNRETVWVTIRLLRERLELDSHEDEEEVEFYPPPRKLNWFMRMRLALTAGAHSR